jgi:hypothetical protein
MRNIYFNSDSCHSDTEHFELSPLMQIGPELSDTRRVCRMKFLQILFRYSVYSDRQIRTASDSHAGAIFNGSSKVMSRCDIKSVGLLSRK